MAYTCSPAGRALHFLSTDTITLQLKFSSTVQANLKSTILGWWRLTVMKQTELLTAVTTKTTIFWDVTPCSLVKFADVSEEWTASSFSIKEKVKQTNSKKLVYLIYSLTLKMCLWISTTLYGITANKTILFTVTTMRTSNLMTMHISVIK
jgi:hypothetical protein